MAVVAVIGRPNVGKSSLFNRLIGRREAIVDDTPGVTRDRLYGEVEWRGRSFYVIDTGGILGEQSAFSEGIRAHVDEAISECDAVIMVIDGRAGVTPPDEEVAGLLRRSRKPVIVAVNKLDDPKHDDNLPEAWALGFEHVAGISALHGRGIEDLLELLTPLLPEESLLSLSGEGETDADTIRLAIVGRPNVGKSSLLNRLAGSERSLVSPVAGTTRDPVDTSVTLEGQSFRLIDTAGLRRRGRMARSGDGGLEYYSFVRTLAAVDRSDVALLLMDATGPCADQDKKIAAHVVQKGKGLVLILNKWDLVPAKVRERSSDNFVRRIKDEMPFLSWAPVLFASALNGRGVQKVAAAVMAVRENRRRRIPTSSLNRLMRDVLAFDRLPSDRKGRTLRVYYCSQADTEPPTFIFFVNDPSIVNTAFENHVRNKLRGLEDFSGSPVRIFWRGREKE